LVGLSFDGISSDVFGDWLAAIGRERGAYLGNSAAAAPEEIGELVGSTFEVIRGFRAVAGPSQIVQQLDLGRLVVLVRVRALVVLDEWQSRHRPPAGEEPVHGDHATRVPTPARRVDTHDHEQVNASEIVRIDAKLTDELRQRFVGRVGVKGRCERVAAS
jgi:hypothetical protein